jgi:hypothetical protein
MPIEIKPAAWIGQSVFPTIQAAQKKELLNLMAGDQLPTDSECQAADFIISHPEEIVAILACPPPAKAARKPRSDIGQKRKPKALPEKLPNL